MLNLINIYQNKNGKVLKKIYDTSKGGELRKSIRCDCCREIVIEDGDIY